MQSTKDNKNVDIKKTNSTEACVTLDKLGYP
jgi:hypothetical protein